MRRTIIGYPLRAGFAAAMLCAGIPPAASQSVKPQAVPTPFGKDGYDVIAAVTKQECLIVSGVDLKRMVARTSDLQAKGIIRPDVNAAHVKAHAWSTAAAFGLKVEPVFIVTVFKDPEINLCHFGLAIAGFDGKVEIAYTFSMTRSEYKKIDWASFNFADLPSVVRDFSIGPVTARHMKAESKHGR